MSNPGNAPAPEVVFQFERPDFIPLIFHDIEKDINYMQKTLTPGNTYPTATMLHVCDIWIDYIETLYGGNLLVAHQERLNNLKVTIQFWKQDQGFYDYRNAFETPMTPLGYINTVRDAELIHLGRYIYCHRMAMLTLFQVEQGWMYQRGTYNKRKFPDESNRKYMPLNTRVYSWDDLPIREIVAPAYPSSSTNPLPGPSSS
ncbi:hypothetical protein AJ79_08434 [Helicocarpus griseus UAMH5409]|uniref:Uncharacterized protein n=1 Tax=Helicocarpus griseus UAMH5409 TaxID=1447875 RepID=A0A2B7WSI6_9EURO|nr:hypothetical protein AJ79_08434 [Helicocarpus griseus UAMH5409]